MRCIGDAPPVRVAVSTLRFSFHLRGKVGGGLGHIVYRAASEFQNRV